MKIVIALSVLGLAYSACPNSCSGHGTCGANEVCTCYDGFGMGGAPGGDCSDRFCPYELAWVDSPDKDGSTHSYAECSAKGICDRETGQCECFGGFEGKACGRQSCPDSCSGHGTCEYMNELTFGTVYNDYYDAISSSYYGIGVGAVKPSTDYSWDADRARACVCDAGWTGINCASKMCPVGNDIMDERSNTGVSAVAQVQEISLFSGGTDGSGAPASLGSLGDFTGKSFALKFTTKTNETFTTVPIELASADAAGLSDIASDVDSALTNLPNGAISSVTVTALAATGLGRGLQLKVTFDGTSVEGNQHLLEVVSAPCASGCTPKIDGLDKLVSNTNTTSYVKQFTSADYNSFECGRRGKCDFDTGICSCFEGYTGEACGTLTALV